MGQKSVLSEKFGFDIGDCRFVDVFRAPHFEVEWISVIRFHDSSSTRAIEKAKSRYRIVCRPSVIKRKLICRPERPRHVLEGQGGRPTRERLRKAHVGVGPVRVNWTLYFHMRGLASIDNS